MGWLFRKSKTLGPLRWALGKSATGTLTTASAKIGPITISSSGRVAFNPRDRARPSPFVSIRVTTQADLELLFCLGGSRDGPTYGVARGTQWFSHDSDCLVVKAFGVPPSLAWTHSPCLPPRWTMTVVVIGNGPEYTRPVRVTDSDPHDPARQVQRGSRSKSCDWHPPSPRNQHKARRL